MNSKNSTKILDGKNVIDFCAISEARQNTKTYTEKQLSSIPKKNNTGEIAVSRDSFTYSSHVKFWKNFLGDIFNDLDACYINSSRCKFKGRYYYFTHPPKSGISTNQIYTILKDNNLDNFDTLFSVEVNIEQNSVKITTLSEEGEDIVTCIPYTPHFPELDPQIGF